MSVVNIDIRSGIEHPHLLRKRVDPTYISTECKKSSGIISADINIDKQAVRK